MSLRQRIVLTLIAITVILAVPAAYGLVSLNELRAITHTLRTRNAEGSEAFGRLQTALSETERYARAHVSFPTEAEEELAGSIRQVEVQLEALGRFGYAPESRRLRQSWNHLRAVLRDFEPILHGGRGAAIDAYRESRMDPAFDAVRPTLTPIAAAINQVGAREVARAQEVADRAGTTTLLALAAALGVALILGALLTRSILRPIHDLRRGMGQVARGDLEPNLRTPTDRADELGDLARSFDRMTSQLAELDRLKAEFVSVASHEIKTPLSVIRGYASLLLDGIYGEVSEAQRKSLVSISDQTDRLTRLVQRLLDISRFEAGGGRLERRDVDPTVFLRGLAGEFEVLAIQNEIRFGIEVGDDLPAVMTVDPDRLNEVLGNLLSNAFKFTPKGGEICLRAHPNGDGVRIEVEDSGVGIPADKLPKIFEKFFQVENSAQPRSVGSGLGLAIAREIVEAHGGTIGAESREGRGTRFTVTLPVRPPAHA